MRGHRPLSVADVDDNCAHARRIVAFFEIVKAVGIVPGFERPDSSKRDTRHHMTALCLCVHCVESVRVRIAFQKLQSAARMAPLNGKMSGADFWDSRTRHVPAWSELLKKGDRNGSVGRTPLLTALDWSVSHK